MEGQSSFFLFAFLEAFQAAVSASVQNSSPLLGVLGLVWFLLKSGGWLIVLPFAWKGFEYWWLNRIQDQYAAKRQWILLAIDVPRDNVQSPKGVENIFAHLAGAHSNPDYLDYYWKGATQEYFSFEIVGIEGYVQFIIRTNARYRDLVEAAIYSQYPEAQITEVEDYTVGYPTQFPNDRYDLYGTEFILTSDQAYPIRTYVEFEHQMSQELKDPLTTILETLNKLGPGEQAWLQLIIWPTDESWKKPASKIIKDIMKKATGQGGSKGPGLVGGLIGEVSSIGGEAQRQILGTPAGASKPDKTSMPMLLMAPDDKERVEGIARKLKKIGFLVKFRLVYIAPKEKFNATHGREAIIGAIKQFNTGDLNAIKPDTKITGVHAHYIMVERRKNWKKTKLMRRYKARSGYGRDPYILNTEELATIWHFPIKTELAPIRHMVQRTEYKHTPPPTSLPVVGDAGRPGGHNEPIGQKRD